MLPSLSLCIFLLVIPDSLLPTYLSTPSYPSFKIIPPLPPLGPLTTTLS